MLKLELLGPPILTVDGRPVVVDTRKAIALLAYLGVSGQAHRRDALAALLWPDADTARAAGALRRTLSAVRTAVGAHRLTTDRSTVALELGDLEVDVVGTRTLLAQCATHGHGSAEVCERCIEPLSQVAALHRGAFLEGFALRDSAAFDDWQFFTAEECTRELSSALERLTTALVDAGRIPDAINAARRRLALDPLHEPAHRDLIRLYAWNGEHSAALRQYRECVRVLDQELGVPPLYETTEVYEEVMEHRLTPPTPVLSPPPRPAIPATSTEAPQVAPFVGRDVAIGELLAAIADAGDGVVVVVEGEAGIGKTRLVGEALSEPAVAAGRSLTVRCFEGESGLAYGVMVEALRTAADQRGVTWLDELPADLAGEVARLLPEVAGQRSDLGVLPPLDGPGARTRFVDALGRALAAAVEGGAPGIVVIEDLQWIDDASLEVVVHLARRITQRCVALVLTWRTESVSRGHRLRRMTADARRDGTLRAIPLERLDQAAVEQALAGFGVDEPEVARRVGDETEGLPLLVVEYGRALAEDPRSLDGPLPGGAREVLLSRLDAVTDTATQVLATAAVIGRSFELDVVTEASGRTDEEVTAALEELLSRNLVIEVTESSVEHRPVTYDFTHEHLRRLAYDSAALARRRLLHRRVAAALENRVRRTGNDALAGVIATHWGAAGDDPRAADWQARAGAHAAGLLALPEAISHYRTALALGHPDVAGLHERLGDLQMLQGRYGEAIVSYESAAALGEPDHLACLEHKLGVVHHRDGRWDLAERHYEGALQALGATENSQLRSRITADRGLNAYRRGDLEDAQILAERAATTAAEDADPASEAQAANLLGLLARARGDLDGAQDHLRRSLELAQLLDDAAMETSALNNLSLAVGAAGHTQEALRLAVAALERSAAVGDRHREAALHNNIADLLRAQGSADDAMVHLKKAVGIFAEVGEPGVLSPEVWKLVDW